MQNAAPVGACPVPRFRTRRSGARGHRCALVAIDFIRARLAAPPNLLDQDQENPARMCWMREERALDLPAWSGGDIITCKPPLDMARGGGHGRVRQDRRCLALSAGRDGLFGTALLVLRCGRGLIVGPKRSCLAPRLHAVHGRAQRRLGPGPTDGVFTFMVTLTAF